MPQESRLHNEEDFIKPPLEVVRCLPDFKRNGGKERDELATDTRLSLELNLRFSAE